MSAVVHQLERKRRAVERRMIHTLDTQRFTTTPSPGPGEPEERSYADYLTGVACRYVPQGEIETERGGRVIRLRSAIVIVPWGTDVHAGDLVTQIIDAEGNPVNTSTMSIVRIDRPETHYELTLEEFGVI